MKISGNRKYPLYITCIVLQLAIASGCREKTTEPEAPKAGKRNYTWTSDTLAYPGSIQTTMRAIWASSPSNVYVVGHNADSRGKMYRFDGRSWSPVPLITAEGGQINQIFDLWDIYGFNSNNIWAVGESNSMGSLFQSIILHFDGRAWTEAPIKRAGPLFAVWGNHGGDVWAGGGDGTLYRYNGAVWNQVPFDTMFGFLNMTGFSASDIYATASKRVDWQVPYDSTQYFLFHYDGTSWAPVDSFWTMGGTWTWKFGRRLWAGANHTLYSAAYGVFRLTDSGSWDKLFDHDWSLDIGGSSNENIFAVGGINWNVFHWNGTDWKLLETPFSRGEMGMWSAVWTNNVETFIVGNTGEKTYILHGR